MIAKIKPLHAVKVKINIGNSIKLWFMVIVSFILWVTLLVTGVSLLSYYIYCIITKGIFNPETLKYALILIVGAYFCLILDKNKIYDALNIKKNLPFITIEQRKND